jgi:GH15 family glucan-1,4-alpha-glucosidase
MARSLVLGNGNVLVCYDEWGQVRDFYFPWVGLENHVGEQLMHRIGVHADGTMHWLSSGEFEISIQYEPDTLVGNVRAVHRTLELELRFSDIVYNEHDIYVRHVEVHNRASRDRNLKVFFNQQFHISESLHGDTAYYSPELHALIHYKGRRVFLVSARSDDAYFDDYSVGLLGIEGKEGTWRDAEDGSLSKSGIEHGSVDSVIGLTLFVPAGKHRTISYWVAAGRTYRRVERYHRDILTRGPEHLRRTTGDYWRAWVNHNDFESCGADQRHIDLYHRSLLVLRVHTDNHGAIIASGDSSILQSGRDTYSYCWPRDAGYIVLALLRAGHRAPSDDFHNFCNDVLTDDGYLLHKYRPDKSLGSSWHPWVRDGKAQPPIQEDETALTLVTLGEHYEISRDVEFIERLYNPYIKRVADFLVRYRNKTTGLPLPSNDLWEESFGTFTYTAASVYAALKNAAHFAKILGKEVAYKRWDSAATEVKEGIMNNLIEDDGHVLKSLRYTQDGPVPDRTVDASSFYGLFRFGVLDVDDPRLARAYAHIEERLSTDGPHGGIARYEGDNYFRAMQGGPGNPWIITTLWLAEYDIARAKNDTDLEVVRTRMQWVLDRANEAGLLAEQYHPENKVSTSVTPLAWSHAQFALTFLAYTKKLQDLGLCKEDLPKS